MQLAELIQRIQIWENLHTEFKETEIHPDDLAAALTAFANTEGGQLIFGVDKNHQIVGVPDADRLMQRVDQIVYNNCEPPLTILQETISLPEGKTVLVVNVPKGELRPYRTRRGDYFVRTASGKRRASQNELLRLFQSAESLHYDEMLVQRASLLDLDRYAFEQYVHTAYGNSIESFGLTYEDMLRNLGYVRQQNGKLRPTVACILFFGREPQRFLPLAHLVAARLPGTNLANPPDDNKQIYGSIPAQIEDAARFLNIYLKTAHRIQGMEPERYPELPESALREFLVNALAHRDYTLSAPIRLFIFDDRLEIRTPGGLPNNVTLESIRLGGAHVLRNPIIYTLLGRLGLITGVGTGIYRAIRQIQQATGREPELALLGNEFVVTVFRPAAGANP